jgi:hypothetical protein
VASETLPHDFRQRIIVVAKTKQHHSQEFIWKYELLMDVYSPVNIKI